MANALQQDRTVLDIAALRALLFHHEGMRAFVSSLNDSFKFEDANTDADDSLLTIRPTDVLGAAGAGRWVKILLDESDLDPTFANPLYQHKGSYDANTNTPDLDTAPAAGTITLADAYTVSADGLFFTEQVRAGDVLIADKDDPALLTDWTRVERNVDLASETVVGLVELATDGEDAASVVVQGDDARIRNAVHTDVAGEIAGVGVKATPIAADHLLIEDSESGNAKASTPISGLPAATPAAHALGGALHTSSTLAALNALVSDATLIDTTDPRLSDARVPLAHAHDASDITVGTLALARGGTALDTSAVTNGQLLIGNTAGNVFALAALTAGTDISIVNAGGSITINSTASGGGSLDDAYNFGGASPNVIVDNGRVRWGDSGSTPSLSADTVLLIANTSTTGDDVEMSIMSGTSGKVTLNFGDSANEDAFFTQWSNSLSTMSTFIGGTAMYSYSITGGFIFNEGGIATIDFRIESDVDSHFFFLDTGARNQVLCGASAVPNFQSMVRGAFFGDVVTAPTGNPSGGGFMFVTAGALQWHGSSGTVTELAPA